MHVGRLTNPAKALSTALACAIAIFALVAVWQPGGVRVAEAATVPVTAPGFAGAVSTAVPASTVLATIDNGPGTVGASTLAAGGTITINFPAGTVLANIVAGDFSISQAACGGNTAGAATLATAAVPAGTVLTLTVAAGSLSTGAPCPGQGVITISTSATAGGNEITRPAAAGNVNVVVSLNNASADLGSATVAIGPAVTTTSISPTSGPIAGGTAFTLTGTGFITTPGANTVTFSGVPATSVVATSTTTITGVTPAAATAHLSPIIVTNTAGSSVANSLFTYTGTVPGAPQNVSATAGDKQITVTWTAPASPGSSAITGYTVTCSPSGTAAVGGSTTSATITGLTNGTVYTCSVVAANAVGPGPASSSVSATPKVAATAPGAPTNVVATAGDGEADVEWDAPSSTGGSAITGYTVTCSPGGHTESVGASERSVTVTGLDNGTKYTCTVVAENAVGDSTGAKSNSVTPVGGGPGGGPQSVTVNGGAWTFGQNGAVLEGGGQASGMALIIQQVSGRVVLAIWVLTGGLYQFFLPATPGVSTLLSLPGLLVAAIAVLA